MKHKMKKAVLIALSSLIFLETAVSYPAVAFAAEEETADSVGVSETQEVAAGTETGAEAATETPAEADTEANPETADEADPEATDEANPEASDETKPEDGAVAEDESSLEVSAEEEEAEQEEEPVLIEENREEQLLEKAYNSGACGENATWEYSREEGLLKISGTGAMYDYSESEPSPWSRYVHYIHEIQIEDGITHVGNYAFWRDGNVRTFGSAHANDNGFGIEKIYLPETLKSMGEGAFGSMILTGDCKLVIPGNITELPKRALYNVWVDKNSQAGLVLHDNIKVVGEECFADGYPGKDFTLPAKIETIGERAFRGTVLSEELIIPASVKEIGKEAFALQENLRFVTFTRNAPVVGENAFSDSMVIAYYPAGNTTYSESWREESGKAFLTVKWEETGKTLTSGKAGNNITYTCKDGVLRFTGTGAMYDYHSQQLPEWTCADYKELYIDSRITAIGDYCFFGVTTDKLSGFPTSLTRAGKHSFAEAVLKCNGTDLVINIKTIEDYAFYEAGFGGSSGKSVSIKGAEHIGEFALKGGSYFGVSRLKVDLSNAVYIGKGAFQYFHFDDTFSVSDNVEYIGDEAFYCSKGSVETKLHLPPTLTYLGEKAFYECEWLASDAYIDGDNLTFNNNVFAYTYVNNLTFGPGVVTITSGGLMYSRMRRNGDSNVVTVTFLGNKPEFMRNSGANYSGNDLVCKYPADDKTWDGIRDKNKYPNAYSYSSIVFEPYGNVTVNFFDVSAKLVNSKTFKPGVKISEPSETVAGLKSGQTLTGWFKDKDIHSNENKWDFGNAVYHSMDLYAGVGKELCTVRFVTNCDITVEDVVLEKGQSISEILDELEKNQLYFPDKAVGGWYTDSALRNWFSKGKKVTEDLTLYVKWTGEGLYLYEYDGINPIPRKEFYEYGTYMGGVFRNGHYFRGYYSNPEFEGEPITYIIKGEIEPESSVYAKWEPVETAKITVTGYESSVYYTGAAITFPGLEVYDGEKKLTPGKDYTVKYKNNKKVGKAEMVFTFKGTEYSGSKTVSFSIKSLNIKTMKDKDKTLTLDRDSVYLNPNGKYQKPKFKLTAVVGNKTVVLKEKTDYKLIYPNLDPENSSYKADAYKAVGDYTVWIDGCGNYSGRIPVSVHIQDKKPVEKLKATVKNTTLDSEGNLIEPVITVYDGRTPLVNGVDYKVSFVDPPVIGTNRVMISAAPGSEKYVGERYVSFKVTAVPMSKASIVGFAKMMPYEGGEPVEQTLELYKDSKSAKNRVAENKLVYGTDYTIRYENNTSAGTATMYIVGMGRRYSGTVKKTFTIPGTNIKSAKTEGIENRNYSGKAQTMDLKLFFQKNSRADKEYLMNSMEESKFRDMADSSGKRAVQWTYRYVNNVNPGTAKIVITGVNGYLGTITKTFRINVMDKKYAEDAFSVKVDKKVTYTKGGACPEPMVKFGDESLTKGIDYTVSYKDNKKQGTAKVTVTLKGKFKGSFTDTFEIVPADFSKCTVVADDVVYENKKGNAKTSVAVYDINGAKLQPGVDYDTDFEYLCDEAEIEDIGSFVCPLNEGMTVVVTGKGNYAGKEARGSYRIVNKSIKDAVVTLRDGKTPPYKEYTEEPQIFFQNDIYVKLLKGKSKSYTSLSINDYEILGFRNNVEMGTAVMTIRGKGYYGGILEVPFKIVKKTVK